MSSYRRELEEGMRAVKEYAASHAAEGTHLEWRPMDGAGNIALQAGRGRHTQILFRLSKETLTRCAREWDGWQDVRALVEQSLRQG